VPSAADAEEVAAQRAGAGLEAADEANGALPTAPVPRVALVTGGAQRIGRALALVLAEDGFAVAVHYHRSRAAAEAVVEAIRGRGGAALALGADLADEDAVRRLLPQAEQAFGPVGVLVNNAAVFGDDTVVTATRGSWDLHLAVNLRAPFVLIQNLAARLPAEAGGVVINMLDERVWSLTPYFVSYTLAKAGLWTLTQTLALALAPRIRVNGIGPGPTLPSPRQTPEQFVRQRAMTPLGRGTSPQEIASALRYIISAPALTGQMIALDGGQHLGWGQSHRPALLE
jgi:NAD(P)-dependent dehydrogenase (short-subunit alcohol dehydrogenase family)